MCLYRKQAVCLWCKDNHEFQMTATGKHTYRDAVPMLHGVPNLYLEVRTACGRFLQDAVFKVFLKETRHVCSASKTQHGMKHQQKPVVSCLQFLHPRLSAAGWHKFQEALTHFSWARLSASLSSLLRHSHSSSHFHMAEALVQSVV